MRFWNFCHNTVGIHVYEFLALALLLVMIIFAVIHIYKSKRRDKDYEKKIEELKGTSAPTEAEEGAKNL